MRELPVNKCRKLTDGIFVCDRKECCDIASSESQIIENYILRMTLYNTQYRWMDDHFDTSTKNMIDQAIKGVQSIVYIRRPYAWFPLTLDAMPLGCSRKWNGFHIYWHEKQWLFSTERQKFVVDSTENTVDLFHPAEAWVLSNVHLTEPGVNVTANDCK